MRDDASRCVEDNVLPAAGAGGKKTLVPLVQAGYEGGAEHGEIGPAEGPLQVVGLRQRLAPCSKQEEAQQAIADDVAGFAKGKIKRLKVRLTDPKQVVQQRIQKSASVVRRQIRG